MLLSVGGFLASRERVMVADFWVDALSVGVAKFDLAHREQLNLIGGIEALLDCGDVQAALAAVERLDHLLTTHQEEELEYLTRVGYPGLAQILEVQAATEERLDDLRAKIQQADNVPEARRSATRMRMSFVDYLLKGDIHFGSYVQAVGFGGL